MGASAYNEPLKGADTSSGREDAEIPGSKSGQKGGALLPAVPAFRAVALGAFNVLVSVGIVMANKAVMLTFGFKFPVALTFCHAIVTAFGMQAMAAARLFERKPLPAARVLPIAAAYVGFIVFNNLSLKFNTVGFYQLMKIAGTPTVLAIEAVFYHKVPSWSALAATAVLLVGITLATVADSQVASNLVGLLVGLMAMLTSALYQVWAGTKQKELQVNANQLVHQVAPYSVMLLALLLPVMEPLGLTALSGGHAPAGTLLGYSYTPNAVTAILGSSVLGLLVTLSAYMVIGATSTLTYNIVGHIKTVLIMAGGMLLFGDVVTGVKGIGLLMAMAGITWYTLVP